MPITAICSDEPGPTVVINFLSVPYSFAINWQLRTTFSPKHKSKTKYNQKLRDRVKQLIPLVVYKITWSFNFGDLESRDKFPRFDIRTAIQRKRSLNNSFARFNSK